MDGYSLDPVTFEVLQHRLWAINDEAAATIVRVSGTPIVTEAFDFNTAMMTGSGDVVVAGHYILIMSTAIDGVVEHVLSEYMENPGIAPGDMFITNNPYRGAMHQGDAVLVAPVFRDGELVAWSGSTVHQSDMGGPVPGTIAVGSHSIYQEALPIEPIKIVEGGRLRRDIELEYLVRSRTPDLNRLDLLGQIAASRLQAERISAVCDRYGVDGFKETLERLVASTERKLRRRLAELPDGEWCQTSFIEHDGLEDRVYAVRLTMTKAGEQIVLDFTESADQAPSVVNCARGVLRGFALSAVLTLIGYGLPWVPAAYWRVVEIRSRRGSVVDAEWPAGVSMAPTSAGHEVRNVVSGCIGRLLDASEAHAAKAMSCSAAGGSDQMISGRNSSGRPFTTLLFDGLLAGGGARSFADGSDNAGWIHSPGASAANVEVTERNYPLLYLWRRERTDSGGPGRFRGGVGVDRAFVPHEASSEITCTVFGHGFEQPTAAGMGGAMPGLPNGCAIVRGGAVDASSESTFDMGSESWEAQPSKSLTRLRPEDALLAWATGGGGQGDAIDRPPEMVARDVREGLVSVEGAERDYKVALIAADEGWLVDAAGTERLRRAERVRRLGGRTPSRERLTEPPPGRRLSSTMVINSGGTGHQVLCRSCGERLCDATENPKLHVPTEDDSITARWPQATKYEGAVRFVIRKFFCPGCAAQIDSEINLTDQPPLFSTRLVLHDYDQTPDQ